MRFDEIELETVTVDPTPLAGTAPPVVFALASRRSRLLALLIDLSRFSALAIGLSPLLPEPREWMSMSALAGFVVLVSFYYFVGTWLLWGKTIGGAIFDVKVAGGDATMSLKAATLRWCGLYASLLTGGIGFLVAALPGRRSLSDRVSATRCLAAF